MNTFGKRIGTDEQYTTQQSVELILPYIQHFKDKTFGCPFDFEKSQFVQVLRREGFKVVFSHIGMGGGYDFFTYEPKEGDVMLSNPPYSNKAKIIERCMKLNKPGCLLLPIPVLCSSLINKYFHNVEDLGILIPYKRMKFDTPNIKAKDRPSPTFKAGYFGYKFFKQQIILEQKII